MVTLVMAELDSPIGVIRLAATEVGLCALNFADRWESARHYLERRFGQLNFTSQVNPHGAVSELGRYLDGDMTALERIAVDPGGSAFQQKVWTALREIRVGTTTSYGDLACRIGHPQGPRAVGAANGQNPVSIVIPCHRVIAANGSLHGYGGGLERKRWLLMHEGASTECLPGCVKYPMEAVK